jgi:hypothetical protein
MTRLSFPRHRYDALVPHIRGDRQPTVRVHSNRLRLSLCHALMAIRRFQGHCLLQFQAMENVMVSKTPIILDDDAHRPLASDEVLPGSSIQVSTDAGNALAIGRDGGLAAFAQPSGYAMVGPTRETTINRIGSQRVAPKRGRLTVSRSRFRTHYSRIDAWPRFSWRCPR